MRSTDRFSLLALTLLSKWLCSLSNAERDRLAVRLARLAYHLLAIRKKEALKNLNIAFPHQHEKTRIAVLIKTYTFFAQSFLQFLAISKSFRFVDFVVEGKEFLDQSLVKKKGVILVTGHFGRWEMMSAWLGKNHYHCTAVAQKQSNRGADKFFKDLRHQTGMNMIFRKSSLKNMYKILQDNKILILGSDQDAGIRGVFVDFFGRKASTPKGVARFHLNSGADMLFITCQLEKSGQYKIHIQPIIPPEDSIQSITQTFTHMIEEKIRLFPEQYFWFHRRWKTIPDKE